MHETKSQKFRYHSMPTVAVEEIVRGYKDTHCRVRNHHDEQGVMLSEVRHLQWEGFELFKATYLSEARISMRHSNDVITFLLPSDGQVEVSLRSRRTIVTNGAISVPGSQCRELKLPAGRMQVRLGIPTRRFQKLLSLVGGQAPERPLKFEEAPALDAQMLACLVGLIDALLNDAENSQMSGALLAHKIELVEICLLAAWPNSLWHKGTDSDAYIAPRYVRSAIEMIHADPFGAFSVPELATACGVSVRTLQYGFRQFTSCSVSEFITRSRLRIIREKRRKSEPLDEVLERIGQSTFKKLNLEYRIQYGKNIHEA